MDTCERNSRNLHSVKTLDELLAEEAFFRNREKELAAESTARYLLELGLKGEELQQALESFKEWGLV